MEVDSLKLREKAIDDLTEKEIDILTVLFEKTELTSTQKDKIKVLDDLLTALVNYIITREHNVNFVANCYLDMDIVEVSISGDPDGSDQLEFIRDNDKGATYEEMCESLTLRINQISEDFLGKEEL